MRLGILNSLNNIRLQIDKRLQKLFGQKKYGFTTCQVILNFEDWIQVVNFYTLLQDTVLVVSGSAPSVYTLCP